MTEDSKQGVLRRQGLTHQISSLQDDSHPAHLFARSAFRKAILGDHQIPRLAAEGPRPSICEGHALVKFQVR